MLFNKIEFKILETHVTHACNLTCESCGHYSNHNHKGYTPVDMADEWMNNWKSRIQPQYISLLGGEPTLHKNLPEFIEMTHKHWPKSQIRITTNGFFLHRHPRLPEVLEATDTELKVSIHDDSEEYQEKTKDLFSLIDQWQSHYKFRLLTAQSQSVWFRQYKGFGKNMMPYEDNDPEASYSICKWRGCFQLHEGKIWKCAPLAYLQMQKDKYEISEKWDYYLGYKPLEHTARYDEMRTFFNLKAESYCAMCPSQENFFNHPSPLIPVGDLLKKNA